MLLQIRKRGFFILLQKPVSTSELKVSEMLTLAFNLGNYVTQLWNFFIVFSGVVVGWRFSVKEESWGVSQRVIATVLYVLFIVVNGMTIYRTYEWLKHVLADIKRMANFMDNAEAPSIKVMMQNVSIPYEYVQKIVYVSGALTVISSIWISVL